MKLKQFKVCAIMSSGTLFLTNSWLIIGCRNVSVFFVSTYKKTPSEYEKLRCHKIKVNYKNIQQLYSPKLLWAH